MAGDVTGRIARGCLPLAVLASLASPAAGDEPAAPGGPVARVGAEVSTYADTDAVGIVTPAVTATIEDVGAGWSATGGYLADIISAASVDIVSTASRKWNEVRHVGTLAGTYQPRDLALSASGAVSREPDYLSLSGGATASLDLAGKNVTPLVGYTYGHDTAGRTGTPLSVYSLELDRHTVNAALTVLLDRSTTLAVTGDLIFEDGDQSKPYRYVAMFAPDVAPTVERGASVERVNRLRLPERPLEQLPLSRRRYAVTARLAQRTGSATYRLSERLYTDSWGLDASTTDAYYLLDLGPRLFAGPHVRGHLQTEVDFWERAYSVEYQPGGAWTVPELRTGDRELGPLASATAGGVARWYLGRRRLQGAWNVGLVIEGTYTAFLDALYVESRWAGFTALSLGTTIE